MLTSCSVHSVQNKKNQKLWIKEDQSWFSDFEVSGDTVSFKCHISIENGTQETQTVCLLGNFEEDAKHGLVKEETLLASHPDAKNDLIFSLAPGTNSFDICFTGTFDGKHVKQNRLLPDISIVHVVQ